LTAYPDGATLAPLSNDKGRAVTGRQHETDGAPRRRRWGGIGRTALVLAGLAVAALSLGIVTGAVGDNTDPQPAHEPIGPGKRPATGDLPLPDTGPDPCAQLDPNRGSEQLAGLGLSSDRVPQSILISFRLRGYMCHADGLAGSITALVFDMYTPTGAPVGSWTVLRADLPPAEVQGIVEVELDRQDSTPEHRGGQLVTGDALLSELDAGSGNTTTSLWDTARATL
jgi:hypothetical protein